MAVRVTVLILMLRLVRLRLTVVVLIVRLLDGQWFLVVMVLWCVWRGDRVVRYNASLTVAIALVPGGVMDAPGWLLVMMKW